MMKFLRSQSQTVLIIVLGVIGLGFLFYGNAGNLLTSQGNGHVSSDYGRIDGQDLSVAELYAAVRNTRNALIMGGHADQLNQPGARAQVAQEAWRQLLLQREADKLHIQVSDKELADYIRNQSVFQKDGVYSPEAYLNQMAQIQVILRLQPDPGSDPLATAKDTFATIMRDSLRANAVYNALFSTVRDSTQQLGAQYEKFYGPADVSIVTFDPKTIANTVQVSPEEIAAEYKAHPLNPNYRTKEKRNVDYVIWTLTPDQEKLPAKEKAAAIETLGEKALDFALGFQPEPTANSTTPPPLPDFFAEAKKHGLTPVTTGFFTVDTPPAGLPPSTSFNNAAFDLSKDNTISKVIQMDNGVAVLHLAEIQPSELLPLDQVKADITKALAQAKAINTVQAAAEKAASDLKAAVAKGTDFKAAAASLNLKVDTLPGFVPLKAPPSDSRLKTIGYVVSTLTPGQVSDPIPVNDEDSLLIVHLDSRSKADPAGLADFETRFGQRQNQQLRSLVFIDWANWASKQPGTHKPPELEAYGSVE
jgi:parvulin-like peptidyl-prolyl isomerase